MRLNEENIENLYRTSMVLSIHQEILEKRIEESGDLSVKRGRWSAGDTLFSTSFRRLPIWDVSMRIKVPLKQRTVAIKP